MTHIYLVASSSVAIIGVFLPKIDHEERRRRFYNMWAAAYLGFTLTAFSQNTTVGSTKEATSTILIFRTGQRLASPFVRTYHYLEFVQARGKWVYPDLGYVDYGHGNYREVFGGAGRTLYNSERVTLVGVLYFAQALGPVAEDARYLWPLTNLQFRITPKFTSETFYWPYVPLNDSARFQHVLERSKLEYALRERWKVGVGYGGYRHGESDWEHKPFLTSTVSTRAGAFEFWLQKMPDGAQVQLRYTLVHQQRR
jgi:hypothetical protein